ncbi:rRNA biogenesis protein RRP36 [Smittium culicis]|uniref:rRNA biogenesis protein RRP36 n=1 Tax=Smittium culicis TaxID=133412 RepID=A0A1R1XDW8_9FUNG|nr:rRNA biogenesis protein RRP36 [Smittium culicis]
MNRAGQKHINFENDSENEHDSYASNSDYNSDSDNSQNQNSSDEESESEEVKNRMITLRNELKSLPFDKLVEIKQKIGIKEFEKLFSNKKAASSVKDSKETNTKSSGTSLVERKKSNSKKSGSKKKTKNAPSEMSSKRPVSRFRAVVPVKSDKPYDPRFDKATGHFNKDLFEKSYSFLNDYRASEVEEIQNKISKLKNKDTQKVEEYESMLKQIKSKMLTDVNKTKLNDIRKEHRKREKELVEQGKKPFFLKKSTVKQIELSERFEKLKGTKKLDMLLEKKRKRNAAKDHKSMPFKRRNKD